MASLFANIRLVIKNTQEQRAERKKEKQLEKQKRNSFRALVKFCRKIDIAKYSPKPLDTHSFPDYRWLRADKKPSEWIEWKTSGFVSGYHFSLIHQVRGTLVTIKKGDELIAQWVDDHVQRGFGFGLGCQDSLVKDLNAVFEVYTGLIEIYSK